MATINANNDMTHHFTFTAPYGNNTVRYHRLSTAGTTGTIDQGLDKKAIGAGDVVILGDLPCGFVLTDAIVSVVTGFTGAASLGFKYKDGKDSEEVPQNDKYFFDAKDVQTAGVIRADKQTMVKLPKDAQLIMTFAAANTKKSELRVAIMGELVGAP